MSAPPMDAQTSKSPSSHAGDDLDARRRDKAPRWAPAVIVGLMLSAVWLVYRPPGISEGNWRLFGLDYMMLHQRRIDFALQSLRDHGKIPAWYPREFLGSPFWSNVQNFPLLPTRLALLPTGEQDLFTLAVWLSAGMSAGFTYLLARRIGLGMVGSAAAGWTFACGGYLASRTLAGQLGMIETYWALPLVLYLVERIAGGHWRWMIVLGGVCGALAASAHPQHPVYAVAAAGAYLLWRCPWRRALVGIGAIGLGIASFGMQLVPMAQLIGRSSRVLALDPPTNDIVLPYGRLVAMVRPWMHGAPELVREPSGAGPLAKMYAENQAYWWDTVNYVGIAPLVALLALAAWAAISGARPNRAAWFVIGAGGVALFLALPIARDILPPSPFIILRSPARLMYFVNFALSLGLGAVVCLLTRRRAAWSLAVVAIVISMHVWDVHRHARAFMLRATGYFPMPEAFEAALRQEVADGRIGIDVTMEFSINRRIDDVGFFDSITLANVYRSMLDLNPRLPERLNIQEIDGGVLSIRSLRAAGVRLLLTGTQRRDLIHLTGNADTSLYEVPGAADRVVWMSASTARHLRHDEIRKRLRDPSFAVRDALMLPDDAPRLTLPGAPPAERLVPIPWRRPRPDRIEIDLDLAEPGYVRVIEAFDPGWQATLNGRDVPVLQANNMVIAIAVPTGQNRLVLEYFTPGATAGRIVSFIGIAGLCGLGWMLSRNRP